MLLGFIDSFIHLSLVSKIFKDQKFHSGYHESICRWMDTMHGIQTRNYGRAVEFGYTVSALDIFWPVTIGNLLIK